MINRRNVFEALLVLAVAVSLPHGADSVTPQWTPDSPGSDNIEVIVHLPLGLRLSVADIANPELLVSLTEIEGVKDGLLGVSHGWISRLERRPLGRRGRLQRAEVARRRALAG